MSQDTLYIFDYDGTLYDSLDVYASAVREVDEMIIGKESILTREDIAGWLGLSIPDMWREFHPELTPSEQESYSRMIGRLIHTMAKDGQARWYEGVEDYLDGLRKDGIKMVVLSNGTKEDRKLHWELFHMDRWFMTWYDAESYDWKPKCEIVQAVAREYPASKYVVVGDRDSDREAALAIGADFILACDGIFKKI